MTEPAGLITRRSQHDVAQTVRRFREAITAAGLTLFAEVDHGANAAGAGLVLRPTVLLVFGAAKAGTLLMQLRQTAGIDLPLKALVWEDEAGAVWVGCNAPEWVSERHGLGTAAAAPVEAMARGLAGLMATATS